MEKTKTIPVIRTKFLRIKCNSCGNEQTVFSAASTKVCCLVCNQELAATGASKIKTNAKVLKVFE